MEIPKDGAHLLEWHVTLHLYVQQYVQVWGNSCMLCFHPALGEPQGAAGGMLTDEQI